jgi:hypothetical protein
MSLKIDIELLNQPIHYFESVAAYVKFTDVNGERVDPFSFNAALKVGNNDPIYRYLETPPPIVKISTGLYLVSYNSVEMVGHAYLTIIAEYQDPDTEVWLQSIEEARFEMLELRAI